MSTGDALLSACLSGDALTILEISRSRRGLLRKRLDTQGNTPLHVCAIHGHADAVVVLLLLDADCHLMNDAMSLPLHSACEGGHLGVVALLFDHHKTCFKSCPQHLHRAFSMAAKEGHSIICKFLINQFNVMVPLMLNVLDQVLSQKFLSIRYAVTMGDEPAVQEYVKNGVGVNERAWICSESPLEAAVKHRRHRIMELLFEHGADPNIPRRKRSQQGTPSKQVTATALEIAVDNDDAIAVEMLLERGAHTPEPSRMLIHATKEGKTEAATALLRHGVYQPPVKVLLGSSLPGAFEVAAMHNNVPVMKAIVRAGRAEAWELKRARKSARKRGQSDTAAIVAELESFFRMTRRVCLAFLCWRHGSSELSTLPLELIRNVLQTLLNS